MINFYRTRFVSRFISKYILRNPKLRLKLTRLLVKDRDLQVEMFGSRMVINSIKEIGYVNAYESTLSNVVTRDEVGSIINLALILESGDSFVDLGANVGLYSTILSRLHHVFPNLSYYAFEANPDTHARLCRTLEHGPVTVECIALSDREGALQFCSGAVSGAFGHKGSAAQPGFQIAEATVDVPAKRLDQYALQGSSLVLKIDVEGYEWEVLQGATQLFDEKRVKAVYLDGFRDARIPDFLRGHGFTAFDGRSLQSPPQQGFSVLWIKQEWIDQRRRGKSGTPACDGSPG